MRNSCLRITQRVMWRTSLLSQANMTLSFPKFLIALVKVCESSGSKVDEVLARVLQINSEAKLCLHAVLSPC